MKLYELAKEYRELETLLLEAPEEDAKAIEAFSAVAGGLEEKIEGLICLVEEFGAEAESAKTQEQRFAQMRRARENAAKRIKAYIMECLKIANTKKVKTAAGSVSICKASRPTIRWDMGLEWLPERYRKSIQIELDGNAAYEDWKKGELPQGFVAETSEYLRVS